MKKKYSTPSLIKAVSLSAAMATLLSSVSPVFAANFAFTGGANLSTSGMGVSYAHGSHGSVVLSGDDNFCGADNVIGRGGKQQQGVSNSQKITAEQQYERFINNQDYSGRKPYGATAEKVTWGGDSWTTPRGGYMGALTGGIQNAMPEAYGVYSFATGCGSAATGNYSTAFGAGATAKTGGSQAFGVSALASGKATVAMGIGSEASGDFSVAFGGLATASGKSTVAVGTKAKAEKEYAIAIGSRSHAKASGAIAIGSVKSERTEGVNPQRETIAEAENAIAIGSHTYAKTEDSVAVGVNAQVLVNDGVAIGGGSVSDRDKGVKGYDPHLDGETTENGMAWVSTTGAFSVGEVGGSGNGKLTRQITGVAAGSEDTDAVNVAQLKAMRDVIAGGGAWKLSANDTDPTDVNSGNVVDFSVKDTTVGEDNLKVEKSTENNKNKIQFSLNNQLELTSVTTGQSFMNDDGFIIDNGPRMTIDGIDAGNEKITGVEAGEDDTDAVNFKQLKEFTAGIKAGGWKLSVNGGNTTDVEADSTVDFSADATKSGGKNIQIEKGDRNKVTFALADDINVMSVTAGESVMSAAGFGFENGEGPSITVKGIHAGNKTIKGVAAGEEDTDAVNYKQLKEIKNQIVGDSLVKWDEKKKIISIGMEKGGTELDITNKDGDFRVIAGVAEGKNDDDAVNFSQLKEVKTLAENGWKLSVDGNNATDVKAGSTVDFVAGESANGSNKNIKIVKDNDNKVTFTLNDDLKLTSVTTGNSIMDNDGFSFVDGGPKITANGIDADNKKITKVAAGEQDTDAVNYKQLKEIKNQIVGDSLVKWDEDGKLITIGAEKEGIEINITNSKGQERVIDGVRAGKISHDSREAINGDQLLSITETIADFFGGDETDILNGIKPTFTVHNKEYRNVTDAFAAVDTSITDIYTQINNVTENNLVKWEKDQNFITIGKEKGGTKIDITGTDGERIIAGVKDGNLGKDSKEAVNGSQINAISGDIAKYFGGGTEFNNGVFTGPRYNLSHVGVDGKVEQRQHNDVGSALTGLDANIKNVNQNLINSMKDVASYFGGGAGYDENGGWHTPTFKVIQFKANGTSSKENYSNVADAFEGVNNTFTNIHNQISDIKENNLVKWDEDGKLITIGKEKGGTKIDITGSDGERIIAGVKDGDISEGSKEAVNGSQLWKTNENVKGVEKDIKHFRTIVDATSNAIIDIGQEVYNLSQDALLWNEKEGAFVARHGTDGEKTDSKIKFLADGEISEDSTDAINGSQLYKMGDKIANYFGGGASYEDGEWTEPTFKVSQRGENGSIVEKKYNNVAEAFDGVDNSITDIYNQINDVTENSLVKWDEGEKLITIGKEKGGTKIDITGTDGERTIAGVKDGTISRTSTEAVNGSQLFKTNENVKTVTDNIKTVAQNTSKYFGGSTDVLEGIKPTFLIQDKKYDNVFDAFTGVNVSITNIDNKISEMKENSLVKWDEGQKLITIGKDKAGTEINIAGYGKVARSISGVKAAEKGDEAVNKDQLDKSIKDITKNIETVTAAAVLYDKDEEGNVNYGSVTLGGNKNNGQVALHNVKNGSISENSHDAINGSQINKISADIAKFFGGGAKFVNGAFKGLKYTLSAIVDGQIGKANFYDVGSALTGLDKNVQDVNKRLTNVSNKFNQKIEGISKDALLWSEEDEAFVARHEKNGKKTNSKLKYLMDGDISKNSTDAINGSQLYSMSNQLANYFGGGAKYENGKWTAPTFKIVQVNENGETVEKEHHNVADAFGDVNKNMSNINNRIDDVINKVDSDALKWNDKEKAYDAGRDGKPSKIINVADGKVEKDSKDAVNGGQLWETNERVSGVEKDVKHLNNRVDNISNTIADIGDIVNNIDGKVDNIDNKVNDIAEDAVRYDRDENGNKTNKITLTGGDASEPVVIDNVANGKIETGSKEAVNGGQLHDYTQEQMKIILDESKQYTDQRISNITIDAIDEAVDKSKHYTDMKFDVLNYSIESVRKEARQAAAIGLAVSNLRYNDTPGKLSVGFGTGLWRSQSAFAFGAGYTSENGNIRSNVSVTTSGGHWGVGAGFNMTLN
ncbi:Vomp family autotransporter [Bartonella krasnovii]|uniref:Vomp family autotransporter n=1 Tax=Bartonella krasnovii TaxID=2267275 RepID=UPI001F4C7C49|nr:Vomp family autotransporter [Bartonella krasnovii]UNF42302.1 Vomp family autotransporter [Bartonella krasnovii]UNF55510.1 Vomp family autotransporter [Bartonella krasnovii]